MSALGRNLDTASPLNGLMLVEDDAMLRRQLAEALTPMVLPGKLWDCGTLAEARALQAEHLPGLILLDVGLPDGNGLELLVDQHGRQDPATVVVLSGFSDEETIVRAIRLGAAGYLTKQESGDQVCQALQRIVAGEPPLSPSVAQCIMRQIRSEDDPVAGGDPSAPALPPRQFTTLKLLSRGLTYQQIAHQMEISFHTVSAYAQEIYTKLSVRSRGEAVHRARELGIL